MAAIPYPLQPSAEVDRLPAPLNAFRLLAHAETLIGPTIDLGLGILGSESLTPRDRELVVMTVAQATDCAYELAQHTPIARDAGLTPGQPPHASDPAVVTAVRQLLDSHTLSDEALAGLLGHFDHRQCVEIIMVTGYYAMLAGLMNGLRVDIDPSGEHFTHLANRTSADVGSGSDHS